MPCGMGGWNRGDEMEFVVAHHTAPFGKVLLSCATFVLVEKAN